MLRRKIKSESEMDGWQGVWEVVPTYIAWPEQISPERDMKASDEGIQEEMMQVYTRVVAED